MKRKKNSSPTSSFRSGLEHSVAGLLHQLKVEYEYENTKVPYFIEHTYLCDFYIPATGIYIETKGYWPSPDRRKVKTIREQNPDLDLRMCFQDPNKKISKGSKTSYSDWCDRYDIPWCDFKKIPIHWLSNDPTIRRTKESS